MNDQFEELLSAGVWLGPAVLGSLSYGLFSNSTGDDLAGAVVLAIGATLLTAAGVRFNSRGHALIVPAVFIAMFVASWSMRLAR